LNKKETGIPDFLFTTSCCSMQSESVEHLIRQRFPTFSLSIFFFFFFFFSDGGEKNYGVFRDYIEERKRIRGVLPYLLRFGGGGREATRKIRGVRGNALQDDVSGWDVLFFSLSLSASSFLFFLLTSRPYRERLRTCDT
jgi:hypothetical protein